MNAREFSELVGRPHGTVKRWLREGLPHRKYGNVVIIEDTAVAIAWVKEHDRRAGGRVKNRVTRVR